MMHLMPCTGALLMVLYQAGRQFEFSCVAINHEAVVACDAFALLTYATSFIILRCSTLKRVLPLSRNSDKGGGVDVDHANC